MSSHAFLRPVTAGTGNWGWVFARPVTAGTGDNGLIASLPEEEAARIRAIHKNPNTRNQLIRGAMDAIFTTDEMASSNVDERKVKLVKRKCVSCCC